MASATVPAGMRVRTEDKSLSEVFQQLVNASPGSGIFLLVNQKHGGQALYAYAPQDLLATHFASLSPEQLAVQMYNVAGVEEAAGQRLFSALRGFGAAVLCPSSNTLALFSEAAPSEGFASATLFLLDLDLATIDGSVQAELFLGCSISDLAKAGCLFTALQAADGLPSFTFDAARQTFWFPVEPATMGAVRESVKGLCTQNGFHATVQQGRILLLCDQAELGPAHIVIDEAKCAETEPAASPLGVLRAVEKLGIQCCVKGSRGITFHLGSVRCNHCLRRLKIDLEDSKLFSEAHMSLDGTGFFVQLAIACEEEAIAQVKRILWKLDIPPEAISYHVVTLPQTRGFTVERQVTCVSELELITARLEGCSPIPPQCGAQPGSSTAKFLLQGLSCPNCCAFVETTLRRNDPRFLHLVVMPAGQHAEALVQYQAQAGEDHGFLCERFAALGYPATFQNAHEENKLLLQNQLGYREAICQLRLPMHRGPVASLSHSICSEIFQRRRRVFPLLEAKHYELLPSPHGSASSLSDFDNPSNSPSSEHFPEVLYEPVLSTSLGVAVVATTRSSTAVSPGRSRVQPVTAGITIYRSRLAGDTSDWGSDLPARPLSMGLSHTSLTSITPSMSYDSLDNFPTSASASSIDELSHVQPRRLCASQEFHLLANLAETQSHVPFAVEEAPVFYLSLEWTLWFDITFDIKAENRTKEEAQALLQKIGSFSTLQGFWSFWSNLNVPLLRDGCNIKVFKKGIRPIWDDGPNKEGGRWMARAIPKHHRFKIWTELVLMMTAQGPAQDMWSPVCGIVLSTKPSGDVIELWVEGSHGNRQNPTAETCGQTIAACLKSIVFPENDNKVFHYQSHLSYIAYKKNKRGGKRKKKTKHGKGRDGESEGSGDEADYAAPVPAEGKTAAVPIRRNISRDSLAMSASPPLSRGAMSRNASCQSLDEAELLPHHQEVKNWLERHNLGEYFDTLISNGYDDLRAVRDLDDAELDDLGFKKGHKKRLLQETGRLSSQGKPTPPNSPYTSLPMPPMAYQDGVASSLSALLLNSAMGRSSPIPIDATNMRGLSYSEAFGTSLPRSRPWTNTDVRNSALRQQQSPWQHQQLSIGARPPRVSSYDNLEAASRAVGYTPTSRSVPQHAPSQWNALSTLPRPMSAEDLGLT